jgi:serine phosphatase RsbU (regulator of sigma subunit)
MNNAGSVYSLILYLMIIISVVWLLARSQTRILFKTRKLLKEKEETLYDIESKRAILELKNKSITDSLIYAQRIQEALLPSETYLKKFFSESFILFKPKDIVSGDFYWIEEKGEKIFIVAADCTGHGVPGALLSMIGLDMLEKTINEDNIEQPGSILDILSKRLEKTFSMGKSDGTIIMDGMDIGLCVIDRGNRKIEYSGAFFPLYIIRDNHLIDLKGDKYTLGMNPAGASFTNNIMDLLEGDIIYMFSDGYVDQFGGEENKKFMYRRFRYLLMTIHRFPVSDQKTILDENIKTWMGNNNQIDDIMIIGFKPL